jgi:hypothetical protein
MSQASLTERPYVNSNLFSGHYLHDRLQERDEWDCNKVAQETMADLQSLYDLEGGLVDRYGGDALIEVTSGDRGPRISHRGVERVQIGGVVTHPRRE